MKKIKIPAAIMIVLMAAVSLFGCSGQHTQSLTITDPTSADVSMHPLETVAPESEYDKANFATVSGSQHPHIGSDRTAKLKMGYKCLKNQKQRDFYDSIARNAFSISKEVNKNGFHYIKQIVMDNCHFSEAELRLIIMAFTEDHPELFWIADIFGYTNGSAKTVLQLYSKYGINEIQSMIDEINAVAQRLSLEIPKGLSDYEREMKLHDFLIDNCEYAKDITNISDDFDSFTIYGALVNKKAVCEGYSRAFQWLLSLSGIECVNIIGNENDALHMWNSIKLDGKWYYVDLTWNDGNPYSRYDYYNLTTDEMIKYGHETAPLYSELSEDDICGKAKDPACFNIYVPYCDSDENSYIRRSAVTLKGFSDYDINLIVQKLYSAISNNDPFIEIYLDTQSPYAESADKLINSKNGLIFKCVDSANNMYFGKQIDKNNISVIKKEGRKILTVILNYI